MVGAPKLFPFSRRDSFQLPPQSIPRSIGHRPEWIKACKDKKPEDAKAGFVYSGPFTESLLVGNLAVRLQKPIEWDSLEMRARNVQSRGLLQRNTVPGLGFENSTISKTIMIRLQS